jgi:hypothetical protein
MARTFSDLTLTAEQYAKFLYIQYPIVHNLVFVLPPLRVKHLQFLRTVLSATTHKMSYIMVLLTILRLSGICLDYHQILMKLSVIFRLLGRVLYVCYAIATFIQFNQQTRVLEG